MNTPFKFTRDAVFIKRGCSFFHSFLGEKKKSCTSGNTSPVIDFPLRQGRSRGMIDGDAEWRSNQGSRAGYSYVRN